jgi:receptor expression-enhancing protein 5/6
MSTAVNNTLNNIRAQIFKNPTLRKHGEALEAKFKVNVEYIAVGLIALLCSCLFSGFGASFISTMVGVLYPGYATIAALESTKKDDDTEWLAYWVVFATVSLVEHFVEWVLYWIPFYYPVKVTFLLWCMLPQYEGAKWAYNTLIRPVYLSHQTALDAALSSATNKEKST